MNIQETFSHAWKSVPAASKLIFYEKKKLKILAKRKQIKGYMRMDREELIGKLRSIVVESDFPIRE